MIILTNCLSGQADEGCLKVAVKLVQHIKEAAPQTTVIGYERNAPLCDHFLPLNKYMLSGKLQRLLRKRKEPVLFIPFSAKMRSTAVRTFCLALISPRPVTLLQSMYSPMGRFSRWLLKLSRAKMVCLSEQSYLYYRQRLGSRVTYLKAGVDTQRFCPVSPEEKQALRQQYGLALDKPLVLHVGHLKKDRNLTRLLELDSRYHGVVVVSTHDPAGQEQTLRQQLLEAENITLLEGFFADIQQLYQLADVYLFPVTAVKGCIDAPLSALEAAACGIPVVATGFGELKTLVGQEGFYLLTGEDPAQLNEMIAKALQEGKNPRPSVQIYDWNNGAKQLLS